MKQEFYFINFLTGFTALLSEIISDWAQRTVFLWTSESMFLLPLATEHLGDPTRDWMAPLGPGGVNSPQVQVSAHLRKGQGS